MAFIQNVFKNTCVHEILSIRIASWHFMNTITIVHKMCCLIEYKQGKNNNDDIKSTIHKAIICEIYRYHNH